MRSRFKTVLLFSEEAWTKGGDYSAVILDFGLKFKQGSGYAARSNDFSTACGN